MNWLTLSGHRHGKVSREYFAHSAIGATVVSIAFAVGCNLCLLAAEPGMVTRAGEQLQYNRDVRPILAAHCFQCHGPDAAAREADLRLDVRSSAIEDRGGHPAIEPGKPHRSELTRRVTASDADQRMPPASSGLALTAEQIETLRRWIQAGARYQRHWAFIPPQRPPMPPVDGPRWADNPVDLFVMAKLRAEGLLPSVTADAPSLIRRVTLDLTGLPPTLDEIDAFLRDWQNNPETAWTRLVARLLASPRYGERMALPWLDAARYADTNGYFTDNDRTMWPWRDWVIRAFNQDMPFDQFTIEQLAGDLLPRPTIDQKIATGFNRNHTINNETGIIEEEYRTEYVVDRVDTTATVWMGLTFRCARCHDHKYDPISQKDFYRFFSFFNRVPERGLSGSGGNSAPILPVPHAGQQRIDRLKAAVATARRDFAAAEKQLDAAQSNWERTALKQLVEPTHNGLVAHYPLDRDPGTRFRVGKIRFVEGVTGKSAQFDGDACIEHSGAADFDRKAAFSFSVWIQPQAAGCILSRMDDANDMRGFDVTLRKGKAVVNLVHRWGSDAIQVSTRDSLTMRRWHHLCVTYDGSGQAAGIRVFLNGQRQLLDVVIDNLTNTIRTDQPLRIGRRQASASYLGRIDDLRVYDRRLTKQDAEQLAATQLLRGILQRPAAHRTDKQKSSLRAWFLQHRAQGDPARLANKLQRLQTQLQRELKDAPTTMVMRDMPNPHKTYVLQRGQYDQPGDEVSAGFPSFSRAEPEIAATRPRSDPRAAPNRLALARWLVDPSHPLTARVAVNRLWQQFFGVGIVKSTDDFGTQGDWPSHPQLLDWLAVELIQSNWDLKHIVRLIVSSATYRQSSDCSPLLLQLDRDNRLLSRGPRFRMPAEMIRDNALAVSGLLVERLGGPAVKPYQPAGLWTDVTYDSNVNYRQDEGQGSYRRSLYTFWKRQAPPPNMRLFDAPTRETCSVQRSLTNTPLQALVLMNDPTYIEAARKLAERAMLASNGRDDRIVFAFRCATARKPKPGEIEILRRVLRQQYADFRRDTKRAVRLLAVGSSPRDRSLKPEELAAWTTVASMILSLDETITRP